jgi:predicted TIM-barrel fold metal-dependent hydrolase
MLIVDSQVHIWTSGMPTNRAHRQISSFTKDDLLKEMDEAGVNAAVIHPPGWDPNANEVAVNAARQHPDRLSILGNFPLDRPESRTLLDGWKQRPGMLGLRFTFQQPHQQAWLRDGSLDWLWSAAELARVPIGLAAASFLPIVGEIAARHPGLKLHVDHLGRAGGTKDEAAFANLPELLALARYPNVAVKASGAPSYSSQPYPFRNIQTYIKQIYDAFGPERTFWGTDITRMPCSWRQCVTMFTEELSWLSGHDQELVMGRALCNWIDWKLPG